MGRGRGRPTKFVPATIEKLVEAIEVGATLEMAAQYAGIKYNTLSKWRAEARTVIEAIEAGTYQGRIKARDQELINFFNALEDAKNRLGLELQQILYNAARTDPAWALKLLQLKFAADYAPRFGADVGVGAAVGQGGAEMIIRVHFVQPENPIKIETDDLPALNGHPKQLEG